MSAMYKFKFEEQDINFEKNGSLVITSGCQYNRGSDYFQQENRYECGTWQKESPIKSWKTWKGLKAILGPFWRLGNNEVIMNRYTEGIRLGLYNATQFKPSVAKALYDLFSSKIVFDISCGWGDRLFGFYTSNAVEYYGCDPNPKTYEKYMEQCEMYESILGGNSKIDRYDDHFIINGIKKVTIWNKPTEDLDFSQLPILDCVFSSPPYFFN